MQLENGFEGQCQRNTGNIGRVSTANREHGVGNREHCTLHPLIDSNRKIISTLFKNGKSYNECDQRQRLHNRIGTCFNNFRQRLEQVQAGDSAGFFSVNV